MALKGKGFGSNNFSTRQTRKSPRLPSQLMQNFRTPFISKTHNFAEFSHVNIYIIFEAPMTPCSKLLANQKSFN